MHQDKRRGTQHTATHCNTLQHTATHWADASGQTPWHVAMTGTHYDIVRELHRLHAAFPVMASEIPLNLSKAVRDTYT